MSDDIQPAPWDVSMTVFRVPRSHWHCTFENFAWDSVQPSALKSTLERFLEASVSGGAPHLLLTGPPGVGKSHVGVATYRWAALRLGTMLTTWVNVPAFCDRVKSGYADDTASPWDDYEAAQRVVVLDDLFGRDLTPHEANTIVYRLIDTAYQNRAAVLFTMNQSVGELAGRLAQHEISRVLAEHRVVPMTSTAVDWRRGK